LATFWLENAIFHLWLQKNYCRLYLRPKCG